MLQPPAPTRDRAVALLICIAALTLSVSVFWDRLAPDLTALWLAAQFLGTGETAAIYPQGGAFFTGSATPDWVAKAASIGHDDPLTAYKNPPVWAAFLSLLQARFTLQAFQNAALLANSLAILGMIALAWRTAAPTTPATLYLGLALVIIASGPFAAPALFQNQPQISAGFLVVLAIERARAGAGFSAGAALGLAAALAIAPVLLLPALLVAGPGRRIAAGFIVVGGGLGLTSVLLAGPALHAAYLQTLWTISGSVILTPQAYSLDALAAQLWYLGQMSYLEPFAGAPDDLVHWAMAKGPGWRATSAGLLILAAVLPAIAIRRGAGVLIWPAALIALGLAAPLGWSFHYLAPLVFLPALTARLGAWPGCLSALALALPGSYLILPLARDSAILPFADQALGVITLALTASALAALALLRR